MSMLKKALTPAVTNLKVSWPAPLEDGFVILDSPSQDAQGQVNLDADSVSATRDTENAISFFDPQQKDSKSFQQPLKLSEGVFKGFEFQQVPQRPPPIFADSQFSAFALYPHGQVPTGFVEMTGLTPGGAMTLRLPLPPLPSRRRSQGVVHQMAARLLIRDIEEARSNLNSLDAVRLSLHFSVLCQATAFIAIDAHNGCELPVSTDTNASSPEKPMEKKAACQALRLYHPGLQMRSLRAVTNAISWRSEGIIHKKNEVFLDVAEKLTLSVAADGTLLQSEVQGVLRMKSFLSGMPELKLGLNNKLVAQLSSANALGFQGGQLRFHQCARLGRFERDQTISFIPPDGEFVLMDYCASALSTAPIQIKATLFAGLSEMQHEYVVTAKSSFKGNVSAHDIQLMIPLPPDAYGVKLENRHGSAQYGPDEDAVVWSISHMQGLRELVLRVKFCLSSARNDYCGKPPNIRANFSLHGLAASGLVIQYLKIIEKRGYEASKHVRYLTECKDSLHRFLF